MTLSPEEALSCRCHHLQLGPRATDPAARTPAGCPVDASRPCSAPGLHLPTPTCHVPSSPAYLAPPAACSLRLRVISTVCALESEALSALPAPCGHSCVRLGFALRPPGKLFAPQRAGLPVPHGPAHSASSPRWESLCDGCRPQARWPRVR